MWETHLHHMYQAWQQGNDDYIKRYMDFAEFAAGHNNMTTDAMLGQLQTYSWFKIPNFDIPPNCF